MVMRSHLVIALQLEFKLDGLFQSFEAPGGKASDEHRVKYRFNMT